MYWTAESCIVESRVRDVCACVDYVRDAFILSFQLLLADTYNGRLRFIEAVRFISVSNYLHSFEMLIIFTFSVTI